VTYLVTGATGFVGGHLARRLRRDGHPVRALVRDPVKAAPLLALGVELFGGDITERETLRAPMTGVQGVFHCAAWYQLGARDSTPARRTNVDGTRNVLETMRELGVPKGVYTSTLAVFGDTHGRLVDESYRHDGPHLSVYDATKWAAHYEVVLPMMREGLPLVIVQPGVIYGPDDPTIMGRTLERFLKRQLPMVPDKTAYCFSHIDDIVEGHVLAMERGRPGESYIIAGPPHTLVEMMAMVEKISGVPAPRMRAHPGLMRALAKVMEVAGTVVKLPETYHPETLRSMGGATYLGDNAKAKRELGYAPRSLEDGMKEVVPHEMRRLRMD
jgi:nucleoside-diphosphate-sugar epimerase